MAELELLAQGPCRYCKKAIPLRIYLRGSSFRITGNVVYRYPGGYADIMCYDCKEELEGPIRYTVHEWGSMDDERPHKAWPKKK